MGKKRAVYAGAGIEEYWIVDVMRSTITILREPREGDYRSERTAGADETVTFLAFPDDPIPVSSLLVFA